MEKTSIMNTADKIIQEIENLPPDEQQKVIDYCITVEEEELTPEEKAELDRRQAEAERGENLSPVFNSVEEMMSYLRKNVENADKVS